VLTLIARKKKLSAYLLAENIRDSVAIADLPPPEILLYLADVIDETVPSQKARIGKREIHFRYRDIDRLEKLISAKNEGRGGQIAKILAMAMEQGIKGGPELKRFEEKIKREMSRAKNKLKKYTETFF
jgi:hypothetical protein